MDRFFIAKPGRSYEIVDTENELNCYPYNLLSLGKKDNAELFVRFINAVYKAGQEAKQKEIQQVLGILNESQVKILIGDEIRDHKSYDHGQIG